MIGSNALTVDLIGQEDASPEENSIVLQAPSALLTQGPQARINWDAAMLASLSRL
jgi:hypothetical protein